MYIYVCIIMLNMCAAHSWRMILLKHNLFHIMVLRLNTLYMHIEVEDNI